MDTNDDVLEPVAEQPEGPPAPREKAPLIENRFLFVDIAAMRAKQLRRGANPRLEDDQVDTPRVVPHKAERVAMEEVRRCLVLYEVPPPPGPPAR
jgi:DNA-directed RNA polymerase subunit K/omega